MQWAEAAGWQLSPQGPSATSQQGWGSLEPGRDDLGEVRREQDLSPQWHGGGGWGCGREWYVLRNPWHARASLRVQTPSPGWGVTCLRSHSDSDGGWWYLAGSLKPARTGPSALRSFSSVPLPTPSFRGQTRLAM